MERIINVALVGHVANGKTTLVGALSGVNTKRSSAEQKSGKTIKLGYANCLMWKCNCGEVMTTGQNVKKIECSGNGSSGCSKEMTLKHKISFVDAPGHHSYVHTMVKGATVVDAALLVTDIRREAMQTQTMEHLAILSILGVENVIVVQNKADLVDSKRCIEHYQELKKELKGTTAENAPIIPVSAQNDINIGVLRKVLAEMLDKMNLVEESKSGVFQIIRSFDINKPGSESEALKGGVIGGTVIGNAKYSVDDIVEIKPGLIRKDGSCQTLETKINSIFAESMSVKTTTIGGLYGLGTKLDPALTRADHLSGHLLGLRGTLPDIIREINMKIVSVKLSDKKIKVKEGGLYRLIIGNVVVDAIADKVREKTVLMKLLRPICTVESRCLIYQQESSNTQMIAFGKFGVERAGIPKVEIDQPIYGELVNDLVVSARVKAKIPPVKLAKENKNAIWENIADFAKAINRSIDDVQKRVAEETLLNVSMCRSGLRMYKTVANSYRLESILKKYIKECIVCRQCLSLNTDNEKCLDCGACVRDLTT